MVRAILDGTKTQTRRVAKLTANGHVKEPGGHRRWHTADFDARLACPYGQPGDRLWVREKFQPLLADGVEYWRADWETGKGYAISYPATDGIEEWIDADENIGSGCKPSIHMPRWASRITLDVAGGRLEKLQDISEADAIAEGVESFTYRGFTTYRNYALTEKWAEVSPMLESPIESYRTLWESINGPDSWAVNPLVWAVDFKRIEGSTK